MSQSHIKQNRDEVEHKRNVPSIEELPPEIAPLEKNDMLNDRISK
jgi:hypothetical protein